jgi:hypothetical protein
MGARLIFVVLFLFLFTSWETPAGGQVYERTNKEGVRSFSDSPTSKILKSAPEFEVYNKPQWFKSEAGKFSILTPVRLRNTHQILNLRTVDISQSQPDSERIFKFDWFSGKRNMIEFHVSYCDFPEEMSDSDLPEDLIRLQVGQLIGSPQDSNLIPRTPISLGRHPGNEFVMKGAEEEEPPMVAKSRVYRVNSRFYLIMVSFPKSEERNAQIKDFLTSFKLVN